MTDPRLERGDLPPEFNRAVEGQTPDTRDPEEPHLQYNPPHPAPGLGPSGIYDIVREELDGPARDAINAARARFEHGETEQGTPMPTQDFNRAGWDSQDIEEVQQEDRERGLNLDNEPEFDEQAQYEYDTWALEEMQARHDERWGDRESVDDYEKYLEDIPDHSVDQSNDQDIGPEH